MMQLEKEKERMEGGGDSFKWSQSIYVEVSHLGEENNKSRKNVFNWFFSLSIAALFPLSH